MNLGCIFANAIVRRLAYVVVAIALASLGVGGEARAQEIPTCHSGNVSPTCTRAEAWQRCQHQASGQEGVSCRIGYRANGNANRYEAWQGGNWYQGPPLYSYAFFWGSTCPAGTSWDESSHSCVTCSVSDPSRSSGWHRAAPTGGCPVTVCQANPSSDMCGYSLVASPQTIVIDGVSWCSMEGATPTGQSCAALEIGTPDANVPNDADGDGISDGNDSSPNNPGAGGGGAEDGSVTGDPDAPGSGNGNTSGGGGDCNTPPRSTGDAILAQIAFQTWATRCAIVSNANAGSGTGEGAGDGSGEQPAWTKGNGPAVPTDNTDYVNEQTRFGLGISPDLLDQENIFGNASCPAFELNIWTVTVSSSDVPGWCTLVTILRGLILIFGAFSALQILMGRGLV